MRLVVLMNSQMLKYYQSANILMLTLKLKETFVEKFQ